MNEILTSDFALFFYLKQKEKTVSLLNFLNGKF